MLAAIREGIPDTGSIGSQLGTPPLPAGCEISEIQGPPVEEFMQFAIRVLFAGLCGLIVGIDREVKNKPLGAQAYILVALGSAALMVITLNFSHSAMANDEDLKVDPTRLIQGIVGGIGFLGAGAIMARGGGQLRGVGSGAAIWAVGSIGVASGLGYYLEALFVSVTIFLVLNLYDWLHRLTLSQSGHPAGEEQTGDRQK